MHIPKVAGTSIRTSLFQAYPSLQQHSFWGNDPLVDRAHMTLLELYEKDLLSIFETRFSFCFVRNPISRFLSAIHTYIQDIYHKDIQYINEFILSLKEEDVMYRREFVHFRPQHMYIYLNHKKYIQFIGRFSSLQEDFKIVSTILGKPLILPKLNESNKKIQISDKVKNHIKTIYETDYKLLGNFF